MANAGLLCTKISSTIPLKPYFKGFFWSITYHIHVISKGF